MVNDASRRAIAGMSDGGLVSFTVGWHRPDAFSKVISHIGSHTRLRGGSEYPYLIRQTRGDPKRIRVFLQDGENDINLTQGNWTLANLNMEPALMFARYDYRFEMGSGGHDLQHGGAIFPDTLRWIWRDYTGSIIDSKLSMAQNFTHFADSRHEFNLKIDNMVNIEFELYPGVWRPIEQLSAGQKGTAILPLIIFVGDGPIILDQPEDNLDNKYIGTTVVPMILQEKMQRQFIVTSHNASLVVMSDSNFVVEMEDLNDSGQAINTGFLCGSHSEFKSSILNVLDGGELALKKRFRKYGLN